MVGADAHAAEVDRPRSDLLCDLRSNPGDWKTKFGFREIGMNAEMMEVNDEELKSMQHKGRTALVLSATGSLERHRAKRWRAQGPTS